MKVRNGFVSNSSSSSFVLDTRDITRRQLSKLIDYLDDDKLNTDEWMASENLESGVVHG
jgi:hypothetical protein